MTYHEKLKDIEKVRNAAQTAKSLGRALDMLGIHRGGKTYKAFIAVCEQNEIPYHFPEAYKTQAIPLEQILIDDSQYISNNIKVKKRLIEAGLLQNICLWCGQGPEWNGKVLVLQLDHINGKRSDNRLENLRILCPNCHTQTETYAGKHRPTS